MSSAILDACIFGIVFSVDLLLLFGIRISILFPRFRIWPPPRKDSWQFWISWIFSSAGMVGAPLVGILDLETLGYYHWFRFLIGGLMIVIGGSFALWGTRTLSAYQSRGLKGKLVMNGPYQYTRNPQYVGFIILYFGVILVLNSLMGLITGTVVVISFLLLPLSEEPWLRQHYGKPYEEYCKKVPRFIGFRSVRLALEKNHL